ncbi:MAG: hypothetical protein ACLR0N_01330 [Bilophila wadsworthia]
MVFLPVPVDASEIILDAGQLWIEHPRATQQVEDGALDSCTCRTSCAVSFSASWMFAVSVSDRAAQTPAP